MWMLFGSETSLWIFRGPSRKWWHSGWWKAAEVFVSLPPPTSLGSPAFAHVLHTIERERVVTCSFNATCGRVQLRREGETASFLKELVFDVALWCRHHGSVGRSNQENDYSAHKDCRFCWSKSFGWGDIRTSNSVSPMAMTVACQSAQLAQLGYEREDGFLLSPSPPPSTLASSPHTLQNHVDLLNRCVKLIILWVLGNQWTVNCTLLKQHQSSDWSIILWGMNKDKSFMRFRGLSCHHSAGKERKYQVVFFVWFCFSASWIK